jgi:predicted Zn-dependent protease
MSRNQIIAVGFCAVLGIGIYLFATTKKPKGADDAAPMAQAARDKPKAQELDIEAYVADVNAKITDETTRQKVADLLKNEQYDSLLVEYSKLDKPLAIAYYSVKMAQQKGTPEALIQAGDYNSTLIQTAPDEKAHNYLASNALLCYQEAVKLDSSKVDYRLRLAAAYMEGGTQPMEGVGILLDIVRKDSNNVDAQMMLGRFGIVSGQYDKAIARLEKILYLQPKNSEALLLIAEAYNGSGNKQKALEMLERCKKTVTNPELIKEIDTYIQQLKKPS